MARREMKQATRLMCQLWVGVLLLFSVVSCSRSSQTPAATLQPAATTAPAGQAPGSQPITFPEGAGQLVYNIVPELSAATYSVEETVLNENNRFNLAAGLTTAVTGTILVDTQNLPGSSIGTITVDISTFKSNNDQRDQAIRDGFLESVKFPLATFTPTLIEGIPAEVQADHIISLKVTGDLTIRQVTKTVTFDVKISVHQEVIKGTATATILMSDFGIGPIVVPGLVETKDKIGITFTFEAHATT